MTSDLDDTEMISELEDREVELNHAEQKKKKELKKNEDSLKDFWNNIKYINIWIVWVPEQQEKERCGESV